MRILLFYLFVFFTLLTYSQENKVYTNNTYLELQAKARSYQYSNIDSSFYYLNKIEKSSNYIHKAFSNGMKGYLYQLINDSINSKKSTNKSYDYLNFVAHSNEKVRLNAYLLNFEGLAEWERFNLKIALEKYKKGKILSEKINDIPQIIKFNSNIALVIGEMGAVAAEIATLKKSVHFIKKNEYLFSRNEYIPIISNTYLNISNAYVRQFNEHPNNVKSLDSALLFCKKAINYAEVNTLTEIVTLESYGDIYVLKKEFSQAKKILLSAHIVAKEINQLPEYINLSFKIGEIYFKEKKQQEALIFFKEVNATYNLITNKEECYSSFLMANYYLAIINDEIGNQKESIYHSKIFLSTYKKIRGKKKVPIDNLNHEIVIKEMEKINNKNALEPLLQILIIIIIILLIPLLLLLFIKNRKKNENEKKEIDFILSENIVEHEKFKFLNENVLDKQKNTKKRKTVLNIDEEKEKEIVSKLTLLIEDKLYLNQDFNQRFVAKKIKTNTAYLSFVVNKHFNKTFSEYINELKINYIINEMTYNPVFKKYTTQAIAESAGFKNAISFRKSFKNKTGYTPLEFLKNLDS